MKTNPEQATSPLPPHPPLRDYYTDEATRRSYLDQSFDASARYYDTINRFMSFGTDGWYRRQTLLRAGLAAGMSMLDVGCGTGLSASAGGDIVGPHGQVIGVEPSRGMLAEALQHQRLHAGVRGVAEGLPVGDNRFDFVCMTFALRHVVDLQKAFHEFQRVLKPGGIVLIVEMTPPRFGLSSHFLRFYMKQVVPFLTRVWSGSRVAQDLYRYCWDSHDQCVPPETILAALQTVGLQDAQRWVDIGLFSEYTAKKPM